MVRNVAVWLVALTVAGMMMAFVLAGAARAQEAAGTPHAAPVVWLTPKGAAR
jgi:hypothetical protein